MEEELDVVKLSLELGLKVSRIVEMLKEIARELSTKEKEYKPANAVRARADSFPQLLASSGLIPAFTFYMSKCSDKKGETGIDMYKEMYELISEPDESGFERKLSDLKRRTLSGNGKQKGWKKVIEEELKEGGGYNTVTAVLAYVLWKTAMRYGLSVTEPKDLVETARLLREIKQSGNSITIERYMLNFVQSFKKVIDALIKKE